MAYYMMDPVTDLRYSARMLLKTPGFTLVAVGLLAAGIGSSTLIFSALNAVFLRPLPVRHPEELVRMVQKTPQLGTRSSFSYLFYENLRDHASTLAAAFGEEEWDSAMTEPAPAEEVKATLVTPEFFDVFGVAALHGRTLTRADAVDDSGTPPAVLSYAFWSRRFNADPGAVGRMITLHGHKFIIVGVMPRDFNGVSADTSPDVRVPVRTAPLLIEAGGTEPVRVEALPNFEIVARLRPGVTLAQAQAESIAIWRSSTEAYYKQFPNNGSAELELRRGMELEPLDRGVSILRDKFGTALKLLVASVDLLMLMACANVAGLLLARGASRREEIAVRLALGATRARLVRHVFVESVLLTAIGAAGGVLLAWMVAPLLAGAFPPLRDLRTERLNLAIRFGMDARVLAFAIAASALAVLIAGLAPAISAARMNLDSVLRGARASSGWRLRQGLIVFQIALCTVLLAGAGLLARTFAELRSVPAGFDRDHIVTFTANPGLTAHTAAQTEAFRVALSDRVRQIPGVADVALASRPLMRGSGMKMTVAPQGERASAQDFLNTSLNQVSPEYFSTMGMRIVAGRDFSPEDPSRTQPPFPAIVNEAFVRRFFPRTEPAGKLFGTAGSAPAQGQYQIIGVVTDAKYRSLREPLSPIIYTSWKAGGYPFQLVVRTTRRPESVIEPVRRALASLDPTLPFTEINTMSEEVDASLAPERMTAALASIFGVVAAALAAIGIYGLLAYAVAQRRREIGIRMAIGARSTDIVRMIGGQTIAMAAAGIAVGLGVSFVAAPWIRSLLYGIAPADPISLATAALFVIAVSAAATAIPAARATRIQPAIALREEKR
jgi:predicted permease